MWGRWGVAGSQPMSTAVHMSQNKLWRYTHLLPTQMTPYLPFVDYFFHSCIMWQKEDHFILSFSPVRSHDASAEILLYVLRMRESTVKLKYHSLTRSAGD
jgi:hypothetical protein